MSFFDDSIAEGLRAIRSIAGNRFTYHRGDDSVSICAVASNRKIRSYDPQGVVILYQITDFLTAACDLVLNGERITPTDGDHITERVGSKVRTFFVSYPDGSQPLFDYSDSGRSQLRVHTVFRGEANA